MTNYAYDTFTGATPLAVLRDGGSADVLQMVIGNTAGMIGETSAIAILAGAAYLLWRGVIDLKIPGTYIVTFVVFMLLFGGHGFDGTYLAAQLAGGGLMLGAWFYGDGLCDQSHHPHGTDCVRRASGDPDRHLPVLWGISGGRVLCDHFLQPSGPAD